jgi:hypothetical protein
MLERPLLSHHDGPLSKDRSFVALVAYLFRQRFSVLGALCVPAAMGMLVALYGEAVPVGTVFLTALSLVAVFGVAFVHLRHVAFAAVAAVAPLPGLVIAGPFAMAHDAGALALLAAYGMAVVAGALWSSTVMSELLANRGREQAALLGPLRLLLPIGAALLALGVVMMAWVPQRALGIWIEIMAGIVSSLTFIVLGALTLPFSETAVTDLNRARERRALRLRLLALVVEARWGMSLAGIALVVAVLGYFGIDALPAKELLIARPVYWAGAALLVFLAGFAVGRDWREALAVVLALAAETLLGLWQWKIAVGQLSVQAFSVVVMTDGVSLMLMLALLDGARRYRSAGDAVEAARLKALEECAGPTIYGCAGAAAAAVPWTVLHGAMATLAVLFLLAAMFAVMVLPAISTALEALVRRRYSVEELYGRG